MSGNDDLETGLPIEELREHTLDPHPDLEGRVRRSINRRSLMADGLELSLDMMLKTVWEYARSILESLPGVKSPEEAGDSTGGIIQDKEE